MISPNSSNNPLLNSTETETRILHVSENTPYSVISATEHHRNRIQTLDLTNPPS